MRKSYEYSHLGGSEILHGHFPTIESEIDDIIRSVKPPGKTKVSKEKTKKGRLLYSPKLMNQLFKREFYSRDWKELRSKYTIEIEGLDEIRGAFKQINFVKDRVMAEIQFGKYSYMLYDLAKFQHFFLERTTDVCVEILACNRLKREMSSGVSYGEMLIFDLKRLRGAFPTVPTKIILVDV